MSLLLRESWVFFLGVGLVLFLATLLGYKLASATGVNEDVHRHEHIAGLREGLFVLLGLLLGFTIAMVLPRFDQRRDLVVEEAHAIGASWLRAQMLPDPQRSESRKLLQQYLAVRESFSGETLGDPQSVEHTIQRTSALQEQLWEQAVTVAEHDQSAVVAGYLQALDEMIGVADKRLAAFEHRVPRAVWIIILLIAVFQSFITGYSLKRRVWLSLV